MNIEQTTLPNGLRVVSVNLPGFDSAAVAAFVKAGARNETEANNGIAHFLEHMAFKGTRSRSALQISAEVEVLGSSVNAYTSHETTCYFVTGLKGTDRPLRRHHRRRPVQLGVRAPRHRDREGRDPAGDTPGDGQPEPRGL